MRPNSLWYHLLSCALLLVLTIVGVPTLQADFTVDIPTDNTFVGLCCGHSVYHNYFSVDIPTMADHVSGATLRLARGRIGTSFAPIPPVFPPLVFTFTHFSAASNMANGSGSVGPGPC